MANISGFNAEVRLLSTVTFPGGIVLTQFADDSDPIDIPNLQVGETAMGLNGDLITWSRANPIVLNIAVIPGSEDDQNLAVLLEVNRPGRGKIMPIDIITLNISYPQGNVVQFITGAITDGAPVSSVVSTGRMRSKTYSLAFENKIGG